MIYQLTTINGIPNYAVARMNSNIRSNLTFAFSFELVIPEIVRNGVNNQLSVKNAFYVLFMM